MGFESLLGNERLKDNLINSLRRDKASHFYLICGPEGAGKHTLARLLAAALMCDDPQKPCLRCSACRKVMDDVHPDFITVVDPDHKSVAVKLVRQIRDDMFIRPNEGKKKIYLFPQELGIEGQNALLKILEEPPSYGVFLLLTDNPEKLLPTVRSRCVELTLQPLKEATLRRELGHAFPGLSADAISAAIVRSGGYLGQAKTLLSGEDSTPQQTLDFVRAFAERNSLLLTQTLVPMEKWKRDSLIPLLQQWLALLESALVCRSGMPALSPLAAQLATQRSGTDLNAAAQIIQTCIEYAQGNVSVAAICGYLQWALRS